MKIAYVAHIGSRSLGVLAKVQGQIEIWNSLGHDARLFCVSDAAPPGNPAYFGWRRWNLFNPRKALLGDLSTFNPDMVYWRPGNVTLHTLAIVIRFGRRIVVEVNSNYRVEGLQYARKSLSELRTYYQNICAEQFLSSRIAGYVCVTHELACLKEFSGQPNRFVSPNGILLNQYRLCKRPASGGAIRLLFMGSPGQPWHGVDCLAGLANKLGREYHIHVIGPNVEQLGRGVRIDNVTVHGYLNQDEYRSIVADMHIGLGSMAFYRNEMYEACPLKVREYVASGLPVILPYQDTAFRDSCPEWVLRLPNEEGALLDAGVVSQIKDFCQKLRNVVVTHEQAADFVDAKFLEARKLAAICQWV